MATAQRPTSAQLRKVRWKLVDPLLGRYSTTSLLTLLDAALASPGCSRCHDHLLLLWTRVQRTAAHQGAEAGAGDLPGLMEAIVRAAPGRGVVTESEPNDPRAQVRFGVNGQRFLLHPGPLDHPLPFLRGARLTALAVDEQLLALRGFTLTTVLELVLRYTDHVVRTLAPAWPDTYEDRGDDEIACGITPGEADAARALADLDPAVLADQCADPQQARRALEWMTADIGDLPLRYDPAGRLLGPALTIVAHGRRRMVPASVALDSFAVALERLVADIPDRHGAQQRVQELTAHRAAQLLGLTHVPADPEALMVIAAPDLRLSVAVVSSLTQGLGSEIEKARATLPAAAPGHGRLIVYGGPKVLGPEVLTDTAYLHVEELAEILADAGGDHALLAWFVAELTEHPGVDAIFHRDPLDAWQAWRRAGTLLRPGPHRPEVAVVPPARADLSWGRASRWAAVDDVLDAAGLPASLEWRSTCWSEPDPGVAGVYADLHRPGDGTHPALLARVSTSPPLAVVAELSTAPGTLLDVEAMAGLADSIRTTLAGSPVLAAHVTLPDGAPIVIELTETSQPHQFPGQGAPPDDDEEEGDRLLLHAVADPASARVGIDIDPVLLARFTGDGRAGHEILGRLIHHLVEQVHEGRHTSPGVTAEEFTDAWDTAHPVLRLTAGATYWPAAAPRFTVPSSIHLHARTLRTAAAAVRDAHVPAGTWQGPEAYCGGSPGEQLLHALEGALDHQISTHQPDLVRELARQLNAAWAERTRGLHELRVNLAAPWGENWEQETGRRQAEASTSTTALQLLLQHALANPPAGEIPADKLAIADLIDLAALVLHCGTTAVAATRKLHDLHLTIEPSGLFTLTSSEPDHDPDDQDGGQAAALAHLGFNADAYQQAQKERFLTHARAGEPHLQEGEQPLVLPDVGQRTPALFTRLPLRAGTPLARADELLHQHWGFGLDSLHAVLATAADWPTDPDGIATATASELVTEAANWSGLPEADLEAAVGRLRLHRGNAATDRQHAYTEVERRVRPATHPLIDHNGQLLLLPWLLATAQDLYGAYLDEGRLPHPELPGPVREALRKHRELLDRELEKNVEAAARDAGLPHRANLLEKTAAKNGIPGLIGEIDLLVADPATSRLWVVEAKNPENAVAPHNLLQHIERFTNRYRDKLLKKAATIQAHAIAAARLCGVNDEQEWTVIPLVVTQVVEAAAFTADPQVAYTTAEQLLDVLTDPRNPHPGWNSPAPTAPLH